MLYTKMPTVENHGATTVAFFNALAALEGVGVIDNNDTEFDKSKEPENVYAKIFMDVSEGFLYLDVKNGKKISLAEAIPHPKWTGEHGYQQGFSAEYDVKDWKQVIEEIKGFIR